MKELLIGGQALIELGSTRGTNDVDFLISDESDNRLFIHDKEKVDKINAAGKGAGNKFFQKIWEMEKDNNSKMATPQALLELKAYAFVQHCLNFKFQKADEAEFDIKFLIRKFNIKPQIVSEFISLGEFSEIEKIVNSVKK